MLKFIPVIIGLLIFSLAGQAKEVGQHWTIKERTVPIPSEISIEFRKSIINSAQPDPLQYIQQTTFETIEQWKRFISKNNVMNTQQAESLIKRWSITVAEESIAGVNVYKVTPNVIDLSNKNRLFIHLHGGGYVLNAGLAGLREAIFIAQYTKMPVLSVDYRMPPEHPFPAAIEDVVAVWQHLLKKRSAISMAVGGSSAGGALALAATHQFKILELDLPGALWVGTPWADLTKTGDTRFTNAGIDRVIPTYEGFLENAAKLYINGQDLKNPLISPVYGNFEKFPPTQLVSGTRDLFLSDTVRVHRKMRVAGVIADLNVYEAFSHADYQTIDDTPEQQQVYGELAKFLSMYLK